MKQKLTKRVERRKQEDPWIKVLRTLTVLGWLLFVVAVVMSYYAAPERVMGIVKYKVQDPRSHWLFPLTDYLFYLLAFNAVMSIVTIAINRFRSRRVSDGAGFNSFLLLVVCSMWLLYLLYVVKV